MQKRGKGKKGRIGKREGEGKKGETREMRVTIENAEYAKMELLAMLDRKYESGEEVISELFTNKREAQENLEDVKRKGEGKKGE
jgi:hypothetical protein